MILAMMISAIEDEEERRTAKGIYDRYAFRMKNYAYSILKNEHDAEDAVQETMIRIIKNIRVFLSLPWKDTEKLVLVYLKNVAFTLYRENKNIAERNWSYDDLDEILADEDMVENVIRKDTADRLNGLIDKLPCDYRDLLTLHYKFGHTISEIASVFGMTEGNTKMKLMRARNALKKKWGDQNDDDE